MPEASGLIGGVLAKNNKQLAYLAFAVLVEQSTMMLDNPLTHDNPPSIRETVFSVIHKLATYGTFWYLMNSPKGVYVLVLTHNFNNRHHILR